MNKKDLPAIAELGKKYKDAGLVVIGIHSLDWPAYYLIDQKGDIVFQTLGPGVEETLEEEIKKLTYFV